MTERPRNQFNKIDAKATDPPSQAQSLLQEYGDDLDRPDLTDAQKEEFLLNLWNIMNIVVDFGFGLGPAPDKPGDKDGENLPDLYIDVLELLGFEDTAHETVAPLSTNEKEEQS